MGNSTTQQCAPNAGLTLNLDGMVAVVTGGGDGIGRGCSLILAYQGASPRSLSATSTKRRLRQ